MTADWLPAEGRVDSRPLSHDRPCSSCGHPAHILPCGPHCDCDPPPLPGIQT